MITIAKVYKAKIPKKSDTQFKETMREFMLMTPSQCEKILQNMSIIPAEDISNKFYYLNTEVFEGKASITNMKIYLNNNTDLAAFNMLLYFQADSMFDVKDAKCIGYEYHDNDIILDKSNNFYEGWCVDFYNI